MALKKALVMVKQMRLATIQSGKVTPFDVQATILNQLGFDHEKFTHYSQGRPFRLTDVSSQVIHDIVA